MMKVVKVMTRIRAVYNSFEIAPAVRPTLAKIRPTSPLGTIAVPIIKRDSLLSKERMNPEAIFPMTATKKIEPVKIHIKEELQFKDFKSKESPIATKKIGVNRWTIGFI